MRRSSSTWAIRSVVGVALVAAAGLALAGVSSSSSAADFEWVLLPKVEINPPKNPQPANTKAAAQVGHIDYDILPSPQAEFDITYTGPQKSVKPGGKITFGVTVSGKLTGGKDTQGFRGAVPIVYVNDRWVASATSVDQNCVDPIGAAPISCTEPRSAKSFVSQTAPTYGETFTIGIGVLNCGGVCYVRYTYVARKPGSGPKPKPKPKPGATAGLGIDYTMPDRFGKRRSNGMIAYLTGKDLHPNQWAVDLKVRRKDGKSCRVGDLLAVSVDGKPLTPKRLLRGKPCRARMLVPDEGTYKVQVRLKTKAGPTLTGQRTIVVQDWLIVGLGDSNGSGEGTPDIPSANAGGVEWQSIRCDRSANSYQAQTARALERRDPRTSVTFIHLACSGASILKGLLGPYVGINPGGYKLSPQVDAMKVLARDREIDAVIVSIGINDLGFAELVVQCLTRSDCPNSRFPESTSETTLAQVMQERLDGLPAAYAQLAAALGTRGVASSRVYLAEYFDSTHDEKGNFCNPLIDTPGPFDFDQSEAEYAYRRILLPLNSAVATAAKKHTWNFVSGAQKLFLRHGYCSSASWIVGLVESTLSQANQNGTLHSTTFGNTKQAAITSLKIRADFYKNGRTRRPRR